MMKSNLALPQCLILGCLLGAGPLAGFAQDVQLSFPRAQEDFPEPVMVVEDTQENRRTREIIAELRERILLEESQQDAFSSSIGEMSFDLGNQLLRLNLYDEALEAFRRAEHLLRINNGLYALEQVPALEGMIQTNMRQRDWEAVDKDMERLVWLYRRNNTSESPEYLKVLEDFAKYHLAAYFWRVDQLGILHLVEAEETLTHIADVSLEKGFPYDPELYEALSITNFQLSQFASSSDRYLDVPELESRAGIGIYMANSYRRGLDYLRRGREVAFQSDNYVHRIHADLILADWYQLFLKRFEAQEFLRRAWSSAKEVGMEDSPEFVQPHVLPRLGYMGLLPDLRGGQSAAPIYVRLDVDQWGLPRNVELAVPNEAEGPSELVIAGNRALRDARQSRFRPAIVDGEPVEYTGYVHSVFLRN